MIRIIFRMQVITAIYIKINSKNIMRNQKILIDI